MNGYMVGLDSDLTARDNIIRNDPPEYQTATAAPGVIVPHQTVARCPASANANGRVDYHSVVEDPTESSTPQRDIRS